VLNMQDTQATEWKAGNTASLSKTISEYDVYSFAGITGDFNPAHINEEYAKSNRFGTRIAHGMLSAGLISSVIGMKLPGPGTIYLEQQLRFTAPVFIGDTITATITIEDIDEWNRMTLTTVCSNQNGKEVLQGKALVIPPKQ